MDTIGLKIRQLRKERKLTQAALAAKLHMSRATLSGIENDTVAEVGIRKVESILNALGYTLTVEPINRRPTLDQVSRNSFHD